MNSAFRRRARSANLYGSSRPLRELVERSERPLPRRPDPLLALRARHARPRPDRLPRRCAPPEHRDARRVRPHRGRTTAATHVKYRIELADARSIESVYMRQAGVTLCVSSRSAARSLRFLPHGKMARATSRSGEIVGQIALIRREQALAASARLNVVFMGMASRCQLRRRDGGLRSAHDPAGFGLSRRRITVSTRVSPQIERLAREPVRRGSPCR